MIVVVALLVSTTGVTIYTHYCDTDRHSTSSLFLDEAISCHPTHSIHPSDCCSTENSSLNGCHQNCCSVVTRVYKLTQDYFNTVMAAEELAPVQIQLFCEVPFSINSAWQIAVNVNQILIRPPPVSGKELLTRLHQLKKIPEHLT